MLVERWGHLDFRTLLRTGAELSPFPAVSDREGWARVVPASREAWIAAAEPFARYAWPALPARLHLEFRRTGENLPYLHAFWERRSALGILTVAECLEDRGRLLDQVATGILATCEETAWMTPFDLSTLGKVVPAHEDLVVNLATTETAALLAWVRFLLGDRLDALDPRIGARIGEEVARRVLRPYLERDDWWWMGFAPSHRLNNWNPWCNRNVLMCLLLLDLDRGLRAAGVRRALASLDAYLARHPPDGCCDEGPMYWGAAGGGLHTCLALLARATGGAIDVFDEPIIRDIGRYLPAVHIHGDWFVDFADGDARVRHGAGAWAYGRSIRDDDLARLGASFDPARPVVLNWFGMYEYLDDLFGEEQRAAARGEAPYPRDAWLWHTQVMTARERRGTSRGLFLAAKGGTNGESHNHNDVGSFIVYLDGEPVLVDLGTEEYTAQTFGPRRYELWYLQSQYHNCPTVRGALQRDGAGFAARAVSHRADDASAEMSADIAGAWPHEAGLAAWRRTCRLVRGADPVVEVDDEFLLEAPGAVSWNLVTPCAVRATGPGAIELRSAAGPVALVRHDPSLAMRVEPTPPLGSRLRRTWGDAMSRIVLAETAGTAPVRRRLAISRG